MKEDYIELTAKQKFLLNMILEEYYKRNYLFNEHVRMNSEEGIRREVLQLLMKSLKQNKIFIKGENENG